jgi:hypothetical protein
MALQFVVNRDAWRDTNQPVSSGPHSVLFQRPIFGWILRDTCCARMSAGVEVGPIDHFNKPIEASLDSGKSQARRVLFNAFQAFFFLCCQLVAK